MLRAKQETEERQRAEAMAEAERIREASIRPVPYFVFPERDASRPVFLHSGEGPS